MSQLFVDNIKNRTGGAVGFPTGVVVTGVATFNNQVSIAGTLTYEDVTNVDSTGIVTAKSGLQLGSAGAGGTFTSAGYGQLEGGLVVSGVTTSTSAIVGSAVTINSTGINISGIITATSFSGPFSASTGSFTGDVDIADKIVHTGDTNTAIRFPAADTFTVETGGSERIRVTSAGKFGVGANPSIFFEVTSDENDVARFTGTNSGNIVFRNDTSNEFQIHTGTSDALIFGTNGENERLRITSTGGFHFTNGELIERAKVTAGKLSDNTNIDLENGMVHLFTTQETTTSTPNIRINSSTSLNSVMAIGETISVTLITTAAAGAYSAQLTIDGNAVTENWTGGSAPDAGGSSGVDIHAYTIIKTADATFTVIATQTTTS